MINEIYYAVGTKGKSTHVFDGKPVVQKLTPDGNDTHAHSVVCFPESPDTVYSYPLFFAKNYFWCKEISLSVFHECMAFGYFKLESWYKFINESVWFHTCIAHMRNTWEVLPDISNVRDYSSLDLPNSSKWGGESQYLNPCLDIRV